MLKKPHFFVAFFANFQECCLRLYKPSSTLFSSHFSQGGNTGNMTPSGISCDPPHWSYATGWVGRVKLERKTLKHSGLSQTSLQAHYFPAISHKEVTQAT